MWCVACVPLQSAFSLCMYGIGNASVAMEHVCRLPEPEFARTFQAAFKMLVATEVDTDRLHLVTAAVL